MKNNMTEEEKMAVNCSFENHRKAMIRAGRDKKAQFKFSVASPRGANQKMVQHDTG